MRISDWSSDVCSSDLMKLPGYILPTSAGPRTCIPFTSSLHRPPEGYRGDYYVTEFTDEKLRARWTACEQDKACRQRVFDQVHKRRTPNRAFRNTDHRHRFLLGKVQEPGPATAMTQHRRPDFFTHQPHPAPFPPGQ